MAEKVEITGVDRLQKRLAALARRHKPVSQAVVKYTAPYAVYVHEDMQAFHPTGQAKFLETAIRTEASHVAQVVRTELAHGKSMEEALLTGGYVVLFASNALVPVDTGFLRASGRVDVR